MTKRLTLVMAMLLCMATAIGQVRMPQLFQDGMVLQRGADIPVWGWATPGDNITVSLLDAKGKALTTATATADSQGRWLLTLPYQKKMKPGKGYSLTLNSTLIKNVALGDVWLCSGQSNIDTTIERVYPQYGKVIDDYENDDIRMFRVQTDFDTHGPKDDIRQTPINWKPVTKDNAWLFSAVGYFLGREMYAKTGIPQGIIVNSVGGSPIQAWLDADTLRQRHPQEYQRTVFYQDDEMVRSLQRANAQAQRRWQQLLDEGDTGLKENYSARDYDDSQWTVQDAFYTMNGRPQSKNLTRGYSYNGTLWARQHITVDATHAGQGARLLVGTIFDADQTYVNGKQVGSTGYQYPPRRYTIPAGLLLEGDNALTVRITTKGGTPHFIPEKPYKLIFDDGTEIALSSQWRTKEGGRMQECPSADAGGQNLPSVLYNGMHYPLAPYALSGVVWYQGESNTGKGGTYGQYLDELISGWRQLWKSDRLPFVVVQLANYMEPSDEPQDTGWSQVREAQRLTAKKTENAELAVIIDLGETVDIHPLRKQEVAQRIARCFDRMLWHKTLPLSPEVVSAKVEGGDIVLTLDQPLLNEGALHEFEVAAADGKFANAEAEGKGATIRIKSPVAAPAKVRYAWKNNPLKADVFSKEGLPMSPMQTDVPF